MAKIETKVWKGPMLSDEKTRIVAQGEERLGLQHFVGFGTEEHHKKMVHTTNITIVEEVEEETPSFSYDTLFQEALAALAHNKPL
jgi:hypothetical protein